MTGLARSDVEKFLPKVARMIHELLSLPDQELTVNESVYKNNAYTALNALYNSLHRHLSNEDCDDLEKHFALIMKQARRRIIK